MRSAAIGSQRRLPTGQLEERIEQVSTADNADGADQHRMLDSVEAPQGRAHLGQVPTEERRPANRADADA